MPVRKNFLLSLYNLGDSLDEEVLYSELIDELEEEFFSYPLLIQRGIRRHCQRIRELCQELESRVADEA